MSKVGEKGNKWQMNNQRIYIIEILKQSNRAIECYQRLCYSLEHHLNEELFCEIEHFIQHAASISLLLWPSPSNKSKNKQQTKARGIYLSKLLEIKDNPLKDRKLSDHLVHIDERLDDWACESTHHNFIDQNIGNINQMISGIANTDCIRNFDPKTFEFNFLAEKFNLNEIYSSIIKLKDSLQNKALVL